MNYIRITHPIARGQQEPVENLIPLGGEWDEFRDNLDDPDVKNLADYVAELERNIRLRPASILKALENRASFGYGAKKAAMMKGKEMTLTGDGCTFQCIGLCAALREMREKHEKRAAIRKRLGVREKTTKDAAN